MDLTDSDEWEPTEELPDVIDDIANFIIAKKEEVAYARKLKGGWEVWLQVELAAHLSSSNDIRTSRLFFSREQAIYKHRGLIELWGKPMGMPGRGLSRDFALGIQLKCEYNGHRVQSRFMADVIKAAAGVKDDDFVRGAENVSSETIEYTKGTQIFCLALTTQESDLSNLDWNSKDDGQAAVQRGVGGNVFHRKILNRSGYTYGYNITDSMSLDQMPRQYSAPNAGPDDFWLMWWEVMYGQTRFAG